MSTYPEKISVIVAIGRDGAIGKNNDLIWHLPGDLPRFKRLTTGHTVIMGRKTWESLPSRPLPGRRNIVISSHSDYTAAGAELASSLHNALSLAANDGDVFIIGGGRVYADAIPLASNLFLTLVDSDTPDADTFIPLQLFDDFIPIKREKGKNKEGMPEFEFVDYIHK